MLAEEALATLSCPLWFSAPALSCSPLPVRDDDKSSITARLLSLSKPDNIKLGYSDFQKLTNKTELRDLVTPDSCQLFNILKMSPDWLALSPAQWDTNPDYIEFRNF